MAVGNVTQVDGLERDQTRFTLGVTNLSIDRDWATLDYTVDQLGRSSTVLGVRLRTAAGSSGGWLSTAP